MLTKHPRRVSHLPRRRGRNRILKASRPDYPFAMKLADGRTMLVAVPGQWTKEDRDGTTLLLPDAVRFLDRVQVLISPRKQVATPGYLSTLREALDMTQAQFAAKIGVAKLTVARWERAELSPGNECLIKIEKLRVQRLAQGVVLPT